MTTNIDHFDQLYPGQFLKAGDFAKGPDTLTIRDVELLELEGEKGPKLSGIVHFMEDRRGLVLNKTNGLCLKKMFGEKPREWSGKRVTLHMDDNVAFGREKVSAIRVYGSPDIEADTEVEIKFRKKKAFKMKLRFTGEKPAAKTGPTAKPAATSGDARQKLVTDLRAKMAAALLANSDQMTADDAKAEAATYTVKGATFDVDVQKIRDAIEAATAPRGES